MRKVCLIIILSLISILFLTESVFAYAPDSKIAKILECIIKELTNN